jgi:large subunit ribosomal protein L17
VHRHQYKGRKLSLKKDQRRALIRGLIDSLILYERIETTLTRAKEITPVFDDLVTKAKRRDLSSVRMVHAYVLSDAAAQKLTTELVKGFSSRNSGYSRIIKTGGRRGDNAPMALVELVLDKDFDKSSLNKLKEQKNSQKDNDAKVNKKAKVGAKS